MNIIDYTFFHGEINLPQAGNADGQAKLAGFIAQHEPELLQDILGYDLWEAFTTGIAQSTIEQKWLDLLSGKVFTNAAGIKKKWPGFVIMPDGQALSLNSSPDFDVVVGRGQAYDPLVNASSVTLPPQFVGIPTLRIMRRNIGGKLRTDEYTIVGSTFSLIAPDKFGEGETFTYVKDPSLGIANRSVGKRSLIANYVYWFFMKNTASYTTSNGEATAKKENSVDHSPDFKMVNAWNQMSDMIMTLKEFLDVNLETYPEFANYVFPYWKYRPTNTMGI